MPSVGSFLRDLRERRGVSIEEISRSTRILHDYLVALEADDLASLPAPVFTKGFIRAYCQALGEAPDRALQLWEESGGRELVQRVDSPALQRARAHAITRAGDVRPRRQGPVLVSFVLLIVLGLALFVTTLALQSWRRAPVDLNLIAPALEPSAPPLVAPEAVPPIETPVPAPSGPGDAASGLQQTDQLAGTVGPMEPTGATRPGTVGPMEPTGAARPGAVVPAEPTGATRPGTVAPAEPSGAARSGDGAVLPPYRLVGRTNEATWIRVRTANGRSSEETIPPGEVREWVSDRPFVLTIGNAGGITLELNGRRLPPLGRRGEVITQLILPADAP